MPSGQGIPETTNLCPAWGTARAISGTPKPLGITLYIVSSRTHVLANFMVAIAHIVSVTYGKQKLILAFCS